MDLQGHIRKLAKQCRLVDKGDEHAFEGHSNALDCRKNKTSRTSEKVNETTKGRWE